VRVSGKKYHYKLYLRNTVDRPGHMKVERFKDIQKRFPERIIMRAVWGSLPKTPTCKRIFKDRLKLFAGPNHLYYHKDPVEYPMHTVKDCTPTQNKRRNLRVQWLREVKQEKDLKVAKWEQEKEDNIKLKLYKKFLHGHFKKIGTEAAGEMTLKEMTIEADKQRMQRIYTERIGQEVQKPAPSIYISLERGVKSPTRLTERYRGLQSATEATSVILGPMSWLLPPRALAVAAACRGEAPEKCEYGLLHLLMCREALSQDFAAKAPQSNRLKALDIQQVQVLTPVLKPARRDAPPAVELEEGDDDDAASYISEGEPAEQTELVSWGKSQRGAWWRVRAALREDLVVRCGISLHSATVRHAAPGEVFQQKGMPRVITYGKAQGCIRMPIQPSGWVTADASRTGGPQYLIRTHAPQWKVAYQAPGGMGGQDVIVRQGLELDSDPAGFLTCGDAVEQAGPSHVRHDGIIRMQITAKTSSGQSPGAMGGE
ncbi:unnamed protein product, partial [Polarella glacialis]